MARYLWENLFPWTISHRRLLSRGMNFYKEDRMETGMKKVFDSMENALRLQFQANAERRAAKAEQEEKEFRERLMQDRKSTRLNSSHMA